MIAPHERPITGPAQGIASNIAARVPVLIADDLTLRAPRLEDFATYAAIACGPRADTIDGPMTREEAWDDFMRMVGLWVLRGHGVWTVQRQNDVVGFALIGFEPGDQEPELGYFTADGFERQGIATKAARAVLNHAFGAMGLKRLVSYIHPDNAASIAVARRLGAVQDGMVEGSEVWVHLPGGAA